MNLPGPWQTVIRKAVSPLDEGVKSLNVGGWRPRDRVDERPRRTAAVLVGILEADQPRIILTQRAQHLAQHAGQVAFPGGSADDSDPSGVRTALREAEEEIGLAPAKVNPIGFLDRVDTITDFRVLPVVGLVEEPATLVADRTEVDDVFTLPLDVALNLASYQVMRLERHGRESVVYHVDWQGRRIWGVTAVILRNLALRVQQRQG